MLPGYEEVEAAWACWIAPVCVPGRHRPSRFPVPCVHPCPIPLPARPWDILLPMISPREMKCNQAHGHGVLEHGALTQTRTGSTCLCCRHHWDYDHVTSKCVRRRVQYFVRSLHVKYAHHSVGKKATKSRACIPFFLYLQKIISFLARAPCWPHIPLHMCLCVRMCVRVCMRACKCVYMHKCPCCVQHHPLRWSALWDWPCRRTNVQPRLPCAGAVRKRRCFPSSCCWAGFRLRWTSCALTPCLGQTQAKPPGRCANLLLAMRASRTARAVVLKSACCLVPCKGFGR